MNHNNANGYYVELASHFNGDNLYWRRVANGTAYDWKKIAWTDSDITGNAATATNADKVDGYHSSDLWRKDGGTWNPNTSISLQATTNNQNWSFEINKNSCTGTFWQINDTSLNALLKVTADDGKVRAPYGFVGNLTGNADTATTAAALSSDAGSATIPVYFTNGKPTTCSTTLGVNISGNAATATKATQDSDGNQINITYTKKSELLDLVYPIGAIYISVVNTSPATLFGGTWEQIEDTFLLSAGTNHIAGTTGGSETMDHTHTMAHTHQQVAVTSGGPSNNTSSGPSTNASGGPSNNTSGSTAITVAQMPSHRHNMGIGMALFNWPGGSNNGFMSHFAYENGGYYYDFNNGRYTNYQGSGSGHTHTLSSHTHTLSSHTHTLSSHTHSIAATTTGGASNATTSAASNNNNMPPYLTVYMWKRTA